MCKVHPLKQAYTVLVFDLITEIINLQEREISIYLYLTSGKWLRISAPVIRHST